MQQPPASTPMQGYTLADRYTRSQGEVLLTGIQALARLPIEQLRADRADGRNTAAFISGYPGSPLGGFDLEVQRALKIVADLPIVHQPAVNEELGATAVMGSQLAPSRPDARYDGVVGVWYGKAPGLDRATDALRHGVFAGTSPQGGAVALVGDDPACKSSTMPSSSDASLVDLHMPILYPGTVAECLELGLHAVAISRASGLWASMKIVTPVADGSGTLTLPALPARPLMPTVEIDGRTWQCEPSAQFLGPRMLEVEREFREVRLPLASDYANLNDLNRVTANPTDARLGIVATGYTYFQLLDALRRLGLTTIDEVADAGIRLLHLRMPVPFDSGLVRLFADGLEEIVIAEEKNPTLEWLVKDALYGGAHQPEVFGKTYRGGEALFRSWGMLDADAMVEPLRLVLEPRLGSRLAPATPVRERIRIPLTENRTPFFCSGCPHNWGTKVPPGALVGAGTGCHGMTLLMDPERVGEGVGITAMGNEGTQWIGMEPFVEADHLFQNYGDGTFFHSAQLAIQNCVAAGKHMTFKILWNSTVAMTGGQDSRLQSEPASGVDGGGGAGSGAGVGVGELVAMLQAYGVSRVAITSDEVDRYKTIDLPPGVEVHDRARIIEVQEALRAVDGVTVLIHDQECAAELRRDRKRGTAPTPATRIVINHRICEGCGDCGDVSGCLSVQPLETAFGRKTTIDQASCNFDYSCVDGDCPAFMEVQVDAGADVQAGVGSRALGDRSRVPLPEPTPTATPTATPTPTPTGTGRRDAIRLRFAGIGGTGVVTVAQILATAAMFDGWEVHGLDQTGLSQKAGPVVSDVVLHTGEAASSNLIGVGQADVLLAFDGLVAAADSAILAANPATAVVASTRRTPTGAMVTNPDRPYPSEAVFERLAAAADGDAMRLLDASTLAARLTGTAAQANVLLLGVALQAGLLPVSVAALEQAVTLNGVAVAANLDALYWGRRWVVDPREVEGLAAAEPERQPPGPSRPLADRIAAMAPAVTSTTTSAMTSAPERAERSDPAGPAELAGRAQLAGLLTMLAGDLEAYQDRAYAERFLDAVQRVHDAERALATGRADLTTAAARNLHKLMAYKDEYEVARLMLLPEVQAAADAVGGDGASFAWKLHPPMLKALGMDDKIPIGSWAAPGIALLAKGKRLRGTRFDLFGRTAHRRMERDMIPEYCDALQRLAAGVSEQNLGEAVRIAELPDQVRGFEDLKTKRAERYRAELSESLDRFGQ